MAYDPLVESRAFLADAATGARIDSGVRRLTVAVGDDLAVTVFLSTEAGEPRVDTWTLERRHEAWELTGGATVEAGPVLERERSPSAVRGALVEWDSGGAVRRRLRRRPWHAPFVHYAVGRAAREVEQLMVAGQSQPVPEHGYVAMVWATRRPPHGVAVGRDGRSLGRVPVAG